MLSVKDLIAQRERKEAAPQATTTAATRATAPVKAPQATVAPTRATEPASKLVATAPVKAVVQSSLSSGLKATDVSAVTRAQRPVTDRIVVPPTTTDKPERASVTIARSQGIVSAQLAKQTAASVPATIAEAEESVSSMTVQTSNGLATVRPAAEAGYFEISFGKSESSLTVSGDMLREVWGVVYTPNKTASVNTTERMARVLAEQAKRLEEREEQEFARRVPREQTLRFRREQFARTLREESAREQVISTSDSDSEAEVEATSSVKAAVRQIGFIQAGKRKI